MVHYYEAMRPYTSHSGAYRSRSSSASRYPSPARSSYGSSSRAGTPLASYGAPSLRTLLQETNDFPYSSRRGSSSSTSTSSCSSRRSSFSRESSAPPQKHVHFKEEREESDITTSPKKDKSTFGFEPTHGFSRTREGSLARVSFEDTTNDRMKMSIRKFHVPTTKDDACRRRQARAAYLSALDDTGITIKNRDKIY